MAKLEPAAAASVLGIAGFQLIQLWNSNAPSLSDIRSAPSGDINLKQQLFDADWLVGGVAMTLGVAFAMLTKDLTALIVMLVMFGMVSLWHHSVLNAHPV